MANSTAEREYLIRSFKSFGKELTERQTEQYLIYAEMLVEWNQKINLTAITEFDEIVWKHFIDSISFEQTGNVSRETLAQNCIDIGTGAGFPGIPIKILYPGCKITLVDTLQKRITFLDEVIKACGLKQIRTIHGRAEDLARDPKHRESYQLCVSRAVANLATLSEYCLPFVKKGGIFVSYKGGDSREEINESKKAIAVFGGEIGRVDEFVIRGSELGRTFVTIKKIQPTPKKYPRKAGTPQKSPIR